MKLGLDDPRSKKAATGCAGLMGIILLMMASSSLMVGTQVGYGENFVWALALGLLAFGCLAFAFLSR